MKAYFLYSKKLPKNLIDLIDQTVKEYGISVEHRHQAITHEQTFDFEDAKKTFQDNVRNIKNADLIIAECSYASSGLGYEISLSLEEKKPVIALYNLSIDVENPRHIRTVPMTFRGNTSKYMMLREYNIANAKKTIEMALKDAKGLVDTKFILIISSVIDRYLEWNVKERGIAKAEVTRNAIEEMMNHDEKYKKYLQGNEI